MKRILLFLIIGLSSNLIFGQDIIVKQNGEEIKSKILEITSETIKYKEFDFQDGPTRNISIMNVFMVIYENGKREKFTTTENIIQKEENKGNKANNGNLLKRGFIGLSFGASIPIGDFADESNGLAKTGVQINLINFGYLFKKNVGIAATWFGAANPIDYDNAEPWSYGGLMVGPLFTFALSEKVEWDFRPMIGYSVINSPEFNFNDGFPQFTFPSEQASSFAFNIGTVVRFNVGNKVSLLLSADYFSTKPEFEDLNFEQQIGTISFGFGVAYRLK
jgi:hypothetical protein